MRKYINVRCYNCLQLYKIKFSRDKDVLARILAFSVCPCGNPHDYRLFRKYRGYWHCERCGVPEPYVMRKNDAICTTCYHTRYWKKVTQKKKMLKLSHGETERSGGAGGDGSASVSPELPVQTAPDIENPAV